MIEREGGIWEGGDGGRGRGEGRRESRGKKKQGRGSILRFLHTQTQCDMHSDLCQLKKLLHRFLPRDKLPVGSHGLLALRLCHLKELFYELEKSPYAMSSWGPHLIGCKGQASIELGPEDVSLLERCPHFRGCFRTGE